MVWSHPHTWSKLWNGQKCPSLLRLPRLTDSRLMAGLAPAALHFLLPPLRYRSGMAVSYRNAHQNAGQPSLAPLSHGLPARLRLRLTASGPSGAKLMNYDSGRRRHTCRLP